MTVVKMEGGLGNQMFQYALGRALSLERGGPLYVDPSPLFDPTPRKAGRFPYDISTVFNINPQWVFPAKIAEKVRIPYFAMRFQRDYPRILGMLGYWTYYHEREERQFTRDPHVFEIKGNIYLEGWWQTENYFKSHEDVIRRDFTFRGVLEGKKAALSREISSVPSVCLNVRRGDRVQFSHLNHLNDVVSADYYRKAVSIVKQKAGRDIKIYIFSDEIDWCRKNFTFDVPHVFVDYEYAGTRFMDYLHLMSMCKYFIIPNSTFAWWGAWLSTYPNKMVIIPDRWNGDFAVDARDIAPLSWVRI